MSSSQNMYAILGAGVFGIVCAATLYVVEHYRQDRRRHAVTQDLARINNELQVLRGELDTLLVQQKKKSTKRARRSRAESYISTSTDDYVSALDADSSDLEFYDVSDDEVDGLARDLIQIDKTLDEGNVTLVEACVLQLHNLCLEFPENPQLLWRLGKAYYRLFEKTDKQEHLEKGINACESALNLKPELASVHKWYAILIGSRSQHQPMRQKILDGYTFKEHVDAALRLDPSDPILHHMLGRFAYDIAELKWYERKLAATLFAEPPQATFEEALEHFLQAEKLQTDLWKENMVYIAKCRIKLGEVEQGVSVLKQAKVVQTDNGGDQQVDDIIKDLLQKYSH